MVWRRILGAALALVLISAGMFFVILETRSGAKPVLVLGIAAMLLGCGVLMLIDSLWPHATRNL